MLIGFDASRAFVLQRTGTENYSFNLLREMLQIDKKNAYKLYLRVPYEIRKDKKRVSEWLANVRDTLPKSNNYRLVLIKNTWFWTQIGLAWELWRRPVHVLFVPAHTLPVLRSNKIKTVVTIHDLGYEYLPQYHKFPDKLWLNKSTEYAVKHADKLIAVSEATKTDLVNKLKADQNKITVVYEGLGIIAKENTGKNLGRYTFEKYHIKNSYLLFIGSIQPRKNLIRAIEAFSLLINRNEIKNKYPHLEFLLIGKKGWLYDQILETPARLDIEERVRFLGHVPDDEVAPILQGCLCFVYPSLFEGFGIPIVEAQSFGVPVVTSNKQPFTEVGGNAAMYVDPESTDSIADGISRILLDEQFTRNLKTKGFENVKRFNWKKAAVETLAVINF